MSGDEMIVWHSREHGVRKMRTGDYFRLKGDTRWYTFTHLWGRREIIACLPGDTRPIHVSLDAIAAIRPTLVEGAGQIGLRQ